METKKNYMDNIWTYQLQNGSLSFDEKMNINAVCLEKTTRGTASFVGIEKYRIKLTKGMPIVIRCDSAIVLNIVASKKCTVAIIAYK